MPARAIGVSIDIHERVPLEQRFEQEMEHFSQLRASNLIGKARCNITNGTIDLYGGTNSTSVTLAGASYDVSGENLALMAAGPENQHEIQYYLNRERVRHAYAECENSYEMTYLRGDIEQTMFWAHTVFKTYMDPTTGDLMSFIYTFNINGQKLAETVINRLAGTNFEYIALLNAYTGVAERTIDRASAAYKSEEGRKYDESTCIGLKTMLTEKNFATYSHLFTLENITDQLWKMRKRPIWPNRIFCPA